mmetsp:Transcript_56867/g.127806  ORF Transcript_56867/g.127806 Transcript_56867/m.127806 type:complete len:358 (+) Transcript_56867:79-1152(+)
MPLSSAHVFASHIGHSGKTTMCFQTSCSYAKRCPDEQVLVIDFTEEGDLTKRLLGGPDAASEKVSDLFGGVFRLLNDAAQQKTTGLTSWLWNREIDLEKHAVRLADHNDHLPGNIFLVSSGAFPREEEQLDAATCKQLAGGIREALEKSTKVWKVFCDTDGDRRPSALTRVAYCLCPQTVVMLHLSKCDLDRIETMMGLLQEYRAKGDIDTQIACIVWNFVKLHTKEPCVSKGHPAIEIPFTPTKVCQDILESCIKRICDTNEELPGLFLWGEMAPEEFVKKTILVQKELADNVLKPSEELGLPFVQMIEDLQASGKKQMNFQSGGVKYEAKDEVIEGALGSLDALCARLGAVSLGS